MQLQYLLELERLNINGLSRGKILEVSKKFDTDRTTVGRFLNGATRMDCLPKIWNYASDGNDHE